MLDRGILVLFLALSTALASPFPQSSTDLATKFSFENGYNDMNLENAIPIQQDSSAQGLSPDTVVIQNADTNLATISYPNADSNPIDLQDATAVNPISSSSIAQNSVIANQENPPVSTDSNSYDPQGAIVADYHLKEDCFSKDSTNIDNDLTQKRGISSSPPSKACPVDQAPGGFKKPDWLKKPDWSRKPQANPHTNQKTKEKENPCTDKSREDYDPLHPIHVSCGGPYIGILERYPEQVLNCKPGYAKSIPERTFFPKSPRTFQYCCVKHRDTPIYFFASFCHQLVDKRPPGGTINGMTRLEFEEIKEVHLKLLRDQGIYPDPDPPDEE